jgi:hypothetical protein
MCSFSHFSSSLYSPPAIKSLEGEKRLTLPSLSFINRDGRRAEGWGNLCPAPFLLYVLLIGVWWELNRRLTGCWEIIAHFLKDRY